MTSLPTIEICPAPWAIVAEILQRHLPGRTIWAFGSRARFAAKPYSNLDLAIIKQMIDNAQRRFLAIEPITNQAT